MVTMERHHGRIRDMAAFHDSLWARMEIQAQRCKVCRESGQENLSAVGMRSRRDLNLGDWLEINQKGMQAAANPFPLLRDWRISSTIRKGHKARDAIPKQS